MKLFQWQKGRQKATEQIQKLTLWSCWGFDVHILRAAKGAVVGKHTDPVDGKEHHRMNITVSGDWLLELYEAEAEEPATRRHCVGVDNYQFRPDIEPHGARFLKDTVILSLGWARKPKVPADEFERFWDTRRGLVLRRLLFLLGVVPVFLLAFVLGFTGIVLGMLWGAVCWIGGSQKWNDALVQFSWDKADALWDSWKRLIKTQDG